MIPMMKPPMLMGGTRGVIGVRSVSSGATASGFTASADDLIICSAWTNGSPITTPTGYTVILSGATGATDPPNGLLGLYIGLFWKRAVGGETSCGVTAHSASAVVYKSTGGTASVGVNQGAIAATTSNSSSAASYAAVGPLQDQSWVHAVGWANLSGGGITRGTPPTGLTLATVDGVGAQYNSNGPVLTTWTARSGGAFPGACANSTYSIEIWTT